MKRIRNVDYYHRDLASPVLLPLAVKYFLTKELKNSKDLLAADELLEILIERCVFALRQDLQDIPADALQGSLAGALQKVEAASDRVEALFLAVNAALPLAHACVYPSVGQSDTLVERKYWSLANSLIPCTPTSIPTLVKVRQCRLCGCWVRDGDKGCPFCFIQAPTGKARRAWERKQIRVQQPPVPRGVPASGPERPADVRWDNPEAHAAGQEFDDDSGEDAGEIDLNAFVEHGDDGDEREEPQ
jgi:hypothetical protein